MVMPFWHEGWLVDSIHAIAWTIEFSWQDSPDQCAMPIKINGPQRTACLEKGSINSELITNLLIK